jgi:hypothetical protein
MVGGAHRQAPVPRWMGEGAPAAATLCGAVPGLTGDGGRCALASVHAWTEGVGAGSSHTMRSRSQTRPQWWEVRTGKRSRLDGGGVPVAATPRGAVPGLAREGGRCTPASIHTWTEGGCRLAPHRVEPFPDSPVMVGGTHRQAFLPGWRGGADRCHTTRSRSQTYPRWWEARTGKCSHLEQRVCRPPPHCAEPFPVSPATMGGARRQASVHGQRGVGCRPPPHLAELFPDSPTWWEAHTGNRPYA